MIELYLLMILKTSLYVYNPHWRKHYDWRVMWEHRSSPHRNHRSTVRGWNQARTQNRVKQESCVINRTLLALLIKIKEKRAQSSDRLPGQEADEGLLSVGKKESSSPLIDILQTITICPHYQQGCYHWVMLADKQASHASFSTAARFQLLLCAAVLAHTCVT